MSDQELRLTQKVFALVERLVRETPVRQIDLEVEGSGVTEVDFSFPASIAELQWHLDTPVNELSFEMTTTSTEVVEHFVHPRLLDAALDSLETRVLDVDVTSILAPTIHAYDDLLDLATPCQVFDFFKQFKISPQLFYTTTVHTLQTHTLHTAIKSLPVTLTAPVRENLFFFRRLTIERCPVELSYIPEKEQLIFWRNAVLKTKQEPRYLKIIGVYTGVPYNCIETEKITLNPTRNSLLYRFKIKFPVREEEIEPRDIALFTLTPPTTDGSTPQPSLVMVKK